MIFLNSFTVQSQPADTYVSSWKRVDSLAELGQPRSAIDLVEKIYAAAQKEKNDPQVLKAIIYKVRLNADFQEGFFNNTIHQLQKEIGSSSAPRKQVLHSILGEVYWKYYQNYWWLFRDRSTLEKILPDSIETWDQTAFYNAISSCYLNSLTRDDLLKSMKIKDYEAILESPVFNNDKQDLPVDLRPTLYDFLAHRALDFFTANEGLKIQPVNTFQIDDLSFFSQPAEFAGILIAPADSSSGKFIALQIFRDLAGFHLGDKSPEALIDTELERFEFVKTWSVIPGKDSLYRDALEKLAKQYSSSPACTDILFTLADFLYNQGQQYDPLGSEKYRYDIKAAFDLCGKALHTYPDANGSLKCKKLITLISQPSVEVTKEYAVPADKPSLALVRFKNVKELSFRLFHANPETFKNEISRLREKQLFSYLCSLPSVQSWTITLPSTEDFQNHSIETEIPGLKSGYYVLVCSFDTVGKDSSGFFTHVTFWASPISYISLRTKNGGTGYYILDRESGKPLDGSVVEAWSSKYNYKTREEDLTKIGRYVADKSGYFFIPPAESKNRHQNIFLKIHHDDDFFISDNFYHFPVTEQNFIPVPVTRFFTDRSIYRPGQTIYFKGILLTKYGTSYKIARNTSTKVTFTDVNGQIVSEQTVPVNDFGSFNGTLIAPQGLLMGRMTISNSSGSYQVWVEEYKRPTFEVTFKPVEGNYKLGEMIRVSGNATGYAGNNISDATVQYRVVRRARIPYWVRGRYYLPPSYSSGTEIVNGSARTLPDGSFAISFPAIPDYTVDKNNNPVFDYSIVVDITDINGETQSSVETVSVGYLSLFVHLEVPENVDLSRDSIFKISTTNLNGRPTPASVTLTLQRIRPPDRIFKEREWKRPDIHLMQREDFYQTFPNDIYDDENNPANWDKVRPCFEKTFNTAIDSLLNLKTANETLLDPGYYLLTAKATDPFGKPVVNTTLFTVFDPGLTEIPVNNLNWYVPLKTSGQPGETAQFLVGSKEKKIEMLVEVRILDSIVSRQWIELGKEQRLVEIPIKEEYRGNFFVNFLFVRHNRVFQNSQLITVPYSNKKLDIAFETFRDKLDPGKEEEWKIKITSPDKKGAEAELLISMYDASLDIFGRNKWSFELFDKYFYFFPWNIEKAFRTISGSIYAPVYFDDEIPYLSYPSLNWFGLYYFGSPHSKLKLGRSAVDYSLDADKTMEVGGKGDEVPPPPQSDTLETNAQIFSLAQRNEIYPEEKISGIQVRRDFRETAFFYPALRTDTSGNLVVQFTVPESVTRWRLQGLAHTRNLNYGLITKDLITRKDLMVFPNIPRFIRQGDTVVFRSKIVNLSDRPLSGTIWINLFNGLSLNSLDKMIVDDLRLPFDVAKDGSVSVEWKIIIPNDPGLSVLKYRISASAENFSDGEEKAIPVFSNRMLVTESLPLPVRGKGDFDFTFDKLLNSGSATNKNSSAKNYRLTFEFAANPVWYAIQALPALNERKYNNADAVFASYYSNELATFLMKSNPVIRNVFESWKTLSPGSLLSNLEKNQTLKSALLQETPWVAEALNDTERKQKLGLYYDYNLLQSLRKENINKLEKMQGPGGGFPWFEGMKESRNVSLNILTGFGRLYHMGIRDSQFEKDVWDMVLKTIDYLDQELRKDYEELKKVIGVKLTDNHLGSFQIQYLYTRSFFMKEKPIPTEVQEAFDYYRDQAGKFWLKFENHQQGMIALSLKRLGNDIVPSLVIKSFSEKALHSDEMGMYWARPEGYYWYQAPVETQAMLIEAFDEITHDQKSVDEMKIWLLKQKQTQLWETSRATADAVYALMLRGSDYLSEDPGITIKIGNEQIDPVKLTDTKTEAGTGYFQLSWSGKEITPEMGKISINKTSTGVAWGAAYWQYFENLDKITQAQTPLKIDKKLFIERNTPSGPKLFPVTDDQLLHVGDKLKIRIILTVDRDLEFVHLKDMRAAAFEPLSSDNKRGNFTELSGYRYQDGVGYYQSTTDQSVNFFFDYLPKRSYVFEYSLVVNATGKFSNGITTVQCMYAPEFSAHSEGIRVSVE